MQHIRRWGDTGTLLEYCQRFINEHLIKHLRSNAAKTAVLAGDLYSTWNPTAKVVTHRGLQPWAESTGWSNQLHSLSLLHSNPIFTHWIGQHIQDGVSHIGYSWIDRLLLHKHGDLKIVKGGSDSGEAWIFLSDHRPIWAEIVILGVILGAGPTPAPFKTTPLKRPTTHYKPMLANYKPRWNGNYSSFPQT